MDLNTFKYDFNIMIYYIKPDYIMEKGKRPL